MAKDIKRLLRKPNLTPKDRHFLRVANLISQDKKGKRILTEEQEQTLINDWQPRTTAETEEFNRYNQAYKTICFAEIDALTIYLQGKLSNASMGMYYRDLQFNPLYKETINTLDELNDFINAQTADNKNFLLDKIEKVKQLLEMFYIVEEKGKGQNATIDIKGYVKKNFLGLRDNLINSYQMLLGFQGFFQHLSKAYGMDLSYRIDLWTKDLHKLMAGFNETLLMALRKDFKQGTPNSDEKNRFKDKELFINIENIKPLTDRAKPAFLEVKRLIGDLLK
jgi:hypothetical protein